MTDIATPKTPSIACTLTPGDLHNRLAWIAELTRDALQSYERRDLVLELRYAREAADRVREMVRRERDCCSFLTFDLREDSQQVRLTISAPEGARGAVDTLFAQFVASAKPRAACGCR